MYASKSDFDYRVEIKKLCDGISNCQEKLNLIGYSFYLSADDYSSKDIIHPFYKDFYQKTNPVGLLINSKTPRTIETQKAQLDKIITNENKFIGGDNCQAFIKEINIRFLPLESHTPCQSLLTAVLSKASGCNLLFNPVVERSIAENFISNYDREYIYKIKNFHALFQSVGVLTTLKHFPFTPQAFDIHKDLVDFKVPYMMMSHLHFPVFQEFKNHIGPIMTTHVFNTMIDKDIITFSKKWIDILKYDLGFKNKLIITDSISMFNSYHKDILNMNSSFDWLQNFNQPSIIFIRAKLAGHDLIINRESLEYQYYMIKGALKALNEDFPYYDDFKKSLEETKEKVLTFIKDNRDYFNRDEFLNQNEFEFLVTGLTQFKETAQSNFCQNERATLIINRFKKIKN